MLCFPSCWGPVLSFPLLSFLPAMQLGRLWLLCSKPNKNICRRNGGSARGHAEQTDPAAAQCSGAGRSQEWRTSLTCHIAACICHMWNRVSSAGSGTWRLTAPYSQRRHRHSHENHSWSASIRISPAVIEARLSSLTQGRWVPPFTSISLSGRQSDGTREK